MSLATPKARPTSPELNYSMPSIDLWSLGVNPSRQFHSAKEFAEIIRATVGYDLMCFQTAPGQLKGTIKTAWICPDAFCMFHDQNLPMLCSGLRNMDYALFGVSFPSNEQGVGEVPFYWKNKAQAHFLVGGFGLNETVTHHLLNANQSCCYLWVKRSALKQVLDTPEMATVHAYMCACNSCLVPPATHAKIVSYLIAALSVPVLMKHMTKVTTTIESPVMSVLNVLQDSSFADSLPSKQLMPSSTVLLNKTKEIRDRFTDGGLNVEQLCKLTGLGRTQLNAACQEVFHSTPKQFLRSFGLEEAKHLLRSPNLREIYGLKTIADVHNHVGWTSGSGFRKAFGEWYDQTPSDCWVSFED